MYAHLTRYHAYNHICKQTTLLRSVTAPQVPPLLTTDTTRGHCPGRAAPPRINFNLLLHNRKWSVLSTQPQKCLYWPARHREVSKQQATPSTRVWKISWPKVENLFQEVNCSIDRFLKIWEGKPRLPSSPFLWAGLWELWKPILHPAMNYWDTSYRNQIPWMIRRMQPLLVVKAVH